LDWIGSAKTDPRPTLKWCGCSPLAPAEFNARGRRYWSPRAGENCSPLVSALDTARSYVSGRRHAREIELSYVSERCGELGLDQATYRQGGLENDIHRVDPEKEGGPKNDIYTGWTQNGI